MLCVHQSVALKLVLLAVSPLFAKLIKYIADTLRKTKFKQISEYLLSVIDTIKW